MRKQFLIFGIILSAISKILQLGYKSLWGDIIILPAAMLFVLAILLYWHGYTDYLHQDSTKNKARVFALFFCLAVLSFQLFTMIAFGKGIQAGYLFLLPILVFTSCSIYIWKSLSKDR